MSVVGQNSMEMWEEKIKHRSGGPAKVFYILTTMKVFL